MADPYKLKMTDLLFGHSIPFVPSSPLTHPDRALQAVLELQELHPIPGLLRLLFHPGKIIINKYISWKSSLCSC